MNKELIQVLGQRPACTGSGMYLQAFYQEARSRDYSQKIVAAVQQGSEDSDCANFGDDFIPVEFLSSELSFPIFGMSDNMPYRSRTYSSLSVSEKQKLLSVYSKKVAQVAERMDNPTILAHHLWLITSAVAKDFENSRVIGISHGTGVRQIQKNTRFAPEVREGISRLNKIFALNKHQKFEIVDKFDVSPAKIEVTGLGYNQHNFYLPSRKELQIRKEREITEIAYVGKLSRSKGVFSLLRAVDDLEKEGLKLTLIGSGKGEERESIEKLANDVSSQVELTGLLGQQEVGKRLRTADIFCLPSFYEGFALVILEALACGLRVVSSDIPGVAEYLPDIIEEKNVLEFVELPPMKEVDIPAKEELLKYENRLSRSLQKQLQRTEDLSFLADDKYHSAVKSLSWSGVFAGLEEYF